MFQQNTVIAVIVILSGLSKAGPDGQVASGAFLMRKEILKWLFLIFLMALR